ncbi:unnamed protein product, partial [Cochlearia groenlandica]
KESNTNSINRKSNRNGLGPSTHNLGATSSKSRKKQLTIDGVEPDYGTLLEDAHTNRKTGLIQDPLASQVVEIIKKKKTERMTQLSQEESADSNELSREEINQIFFE